MANLGDFNANDVPPAGDFTPIPEGKYEAMIVESERVDNQSGNGSHLKLTFVVTKGDHAERLLWHRLNLDNPSEKAVQIARGQLSAICRAVGVLVPKDSTALHNLPMTISVKQEKYGEDSITNKITAFAPKDGTAPAPTQQKAAPQTATASAKPATAPWKR